MTEDQKRQLYLLGALLVALVVILYFQMGKVRQLRDEEKLLGADAVREEMKKAKLPLRIGPAASDVVQVTGMELFDPKMHVVSVHEVEDEEKRHLAWANPNMPTPHLVALDFLPEEIISATAPRYQPIFWQSGALEWEEDGKTIQGIPDGLGGYFDLTGASVKANLLHRYHAGRDSLPVLNHPRCVTPEAAAAEQVVGTTWEKYLNDGDRVLGLVLEDSAKAYPIRILNYHEIVNDTCGDEEVTIVYSPLSGSGIAYRAWVKDGTAVFGHSGLLYDSATVMYDRETRSLWTHFDGEAVAGPSKGERLEALPLIQTTWKQWRERFPDTLVLSAQTGYPLRYGIDPYRPEDIRADYFAVERLIVPITLPQGGYDVAIAPIDDRLSNKEWVLGIRGETARIAYPISELARLEENPRVVEVEGERITLGYDPESQTGFATDAEGRFLAEATLALWFAWYAAYPDTELFLTDSEVPLEG